LLNISYCPVQLLSQSSGAASSKTTMLTGSGQGRLASCAVHFRHFLSIRERGRCRIISTRLNEVEIDLLESATQWMNTAVGWSDIIEDLDEEARQHVPTMKDMRFCVISARRASDRVSVHYMRRIQSSFTAVGATLHWYVDRASAAQYHNLGFEVHVGGNLSHSRNLALRDAEMSAKACVQISDDISKWQYDLRHRGVARQVPVSPVAAARFILAKMRASTSTQRPLLGGSFPTKSQRRQQQPFSPYAKISTNFFVVDRSNLRFDPRLVLFENLDITLKHLKKQGSVLRCNALLITKRSNHSGGKDYMARDLIEGAEASFRLLRERWSNELIFYRHALFGHALGFVGPYRLKTCESAIRMRTAARAVAEESHDEEEAIEEDDHATEHILCVLTHAQCQPQGLHNRLQEELIRKGIDEQDFEENGKILDKDGQEVDIRMGISPTIFPVTIILQNAEATFQ